jgi:hypothetical protein
VGAEWNSGFERESARALSLSIDALSRARSLSLLVYDTGGFQERIRGRERGVYVRPHILFIILRV